MSIPPLTRTSEPFRYHERVVGDVWLKHAGETTPVPEGPHVYTQRAAWLNAWITAIGSAQTTVHLSLPTLTHAALVAALAQAAKQRQVRVYIITTEGQGPELKPDEKKVHLAALDFLATSGATLQSTTTFHPTLLLIDAASPNPRAFLESGEGLCVDEPTLAPNLQRLFALGWWRHGLNRLSRAGAGKAEQPAAFPAQRVIAGVPIDVRPIVKPPAKPVARLEVADARTAFVTSAQGKLWVALESLEAEPALLTQLTDKAKDPACDLRVLIPTRSPQVDTLRKLLAAGVKVRVSPGAAYLLADDRAWVVGGRKYGREPVNGLACAAVLTGLAGAELHTRFTQRWENAELTLSAQAKLGEIRTAYLVITAPETAPWLPAPTPKKFILLTTPWTANSAADLSDSAPHREAKDDPTCNALELIYEWQVIPPKLPVDAKEEFKLGPEPTTKGAERTKTPYSPRRFLRGKEVFVLIDRTDAIRLSEFRALERQTKVRTVIARE